MNRVTSQAMSSMARLMFKLIEHNEIYEEDFELQIHPLNNRKMPEEFLITEIQEFLEQIFMLFIDIEDRELADANELTLVKRVLTKELAAIDSLNDPKYIERLYRFVNTCHLYDCIKDLFEEVVERAQWQRKIHDKLLEDPGEHLKNIGHFLKKVVQLYEAANGEPNPKPALPCPACNKETINYACAWGYNNHVHFHCEHCNTSIMQ
ncbi:hypothetical protein P4T20_05270 [Aneurinibacillus thermoaerophilus]|uniref:hypothetical protein n=1 Tax=Aneurinibacillus thermoaerophilus TaxID=143495 RepID=UPI002E1B0D3E|nr:hypothetical protein [Aneurinibacillus thermoaerophilus]